MTYEEVIAGYKKTLGLLKQTDKKVYKLFIREINHVGKEEVSALMAQLKYNMRVREARKNGKKGNTELHCLNKKYIKGNSRFLRLAISPNNIFYFELEQRDLLGRKRRVNLHLIPVKEEAYLKDTKFASYNSLVNGRYTSEKAYKVSKEKDSYTITTDDRWKFKTKKASIPSIPEAETALTSSVIGY